MTSPLFPDWFRLLFVGLIVVTHLHLIAQSHRKVLVMPCEKLLQQQQQQVAGTRMLRTTAGAGESESESDSDELTHKEARNEDLTALQLQPIHSSINKNLNDTVKEMTSTSKPLTKPKNSTRNTAKMIYPILLQNEEEKYALKPQELQNMTVVNILFGLNGDNSHFIDEWEVALKSVLMNAPLDAPLHIHLITNGQAQRAIRKKIRQSQIIGSMWRNAITITSYNADAYHDKWMAILEHAGRGHHLDARVTLGGYYRLFAYDILPEGTGPVFYMDTDSVIMANLGNLWKAVDAQYMFQISKTWICSAGIIINTDQAGEFWDLLDKVPKVDYAGDQKLLILVQEQNKDRFGALPTEWDTQLGHGYRREPQKVLNKPGVGILHFNGIRPDFYHKGLALYCERAGGCNTPKDKEMYGQSWGLVDYYIKLPWHWAKHIGSSMIASGKEGYPLEFQEVNTTPPQTVTA